MYDVKEKSIMELQAAMEAGETTSAELVISYMNRIKEINLSGPALNAILELNVEAMTVAMAMDRERKLKGKRSNLHGIPVLIKGNIGTADQMHTSAGSRALKDHYAPEDANLVKQLREAGAVIMGKANLTEMAKFFAVDIKNGYSSWGGQVINPYGADWDASGSSTGSAVAVAASLCAAAVGTETCGSILSPSWRNGIVGLKPTVGLISRGGIVPLASSQDTAGPMGRTVEDVAVLLGGLVGEDQGDSATWYRDDHREKDYTKYLNADSLSGMRIGVNRAVLGGLSEDEQKLFEDAVSVLEKQGAVLVQDTNVDRFSGGYRLMKYEFKANVNHYLAKNAGNGIVKTLGEFIKYNEDHQELCLKYGQDNLQNAEFGTSGRLIEEEYLEEKIKCHMLRDVVEEAFAEHDLEVMVFPGVMDLPAVTNFPGMIVPAGYTSEGKPFGITFMAPEGEEGKLISAGYGYEQVTKLRREPKLV